MLHLPGELLSTVLSKLPVKSLLRFRCVSKLWHSLIESPYLTNLHLNHNEQYSNNVVIIKGEYEHYASLSYLYALDFHTRNDADVEARKLEYPTLPCITSYVQACNGLLCFFPIHRQMAVIWNPATHRHREVPLIREGQGSHKYCFGYDYKTHDYKLVKLRCLCKKETCYTIQVYSLKSDEWGPKRTCDLGDINFPIYVGGVLYWIDCNVARAESEEKIVVFDLDTMERRVLSEPTKDRGILRLSYQQGCVCVSCHNDDTGHVDFWVIKDEGRNYSWSKLGTIKVPYHLSNLGFTLVGNLKKKDLQKVLISDHGFHHWYYDIENEKMKCFHFIGAFQVMNTVTYFESLVRV